MSIAPECDYCEQELTEFGAILFSPPDAEGRVKKWHVCVDCYEKRKPQPQLHVEGSPVGTPHPFDCLCRGRGWVLDPKHVPIPCDPDATTLMDVIR